MLKQCQDSYHSTFGTYNLDLFGWNTDESAITDSGLICFIRQEQKKPAPKKQEPINARSSGPQTENFYDDDSEEQLGEEGLTAIAHTIAAFRKG